MVNAVIETVIEDELIGTAQVPDGVELRLLRNGDDFAIVLDENDLMSTEMSASEEALATLTHTRLGDRIAQQWLIGGYGMGYTLRAALATLPQDASVTVAELVPEIIEWARGPMHKLTDGCLDDPRVTLVNDDVAMLIDTAENAYDVILLDVDNGPEGLTRRLNDDLYSTPGLNAAMNALTPGGILAIWSATADDEFNTHLGKFGFDVSQVNVPAIADGSGVDHVIWFAHKP